MDVRFRPITAWPGERTPAGKQRDGSKVFSMKYIATLESLDRELRWLKARDTAIEADLRESQIRADGWPRAGESPRTSGVIVSFSGDHGPLRIPCDYFKGYAHNLRAIALHLERLRLATNYGVGRHGEQYKGWRQIAAAPAESQMSVESAALFVAIQAYGESDETRGIADWVVRKPENYRSAYRAAAARLHPDIGGARDLWNALQTAKAVLDAHHGGGRATPSAP